MIPPWSGMALMIVPTYNERENIERLVLRLRGLPGDVHVLIVDDASPDGTGQIADALASTDGGVHVIHGHVSHPVRGRRGVSGQGVHPAERLVAEFGDPLEA